MDPAVRICLTLGDVCRSVFHFQEPEDLYTQEFDDGYFEGRVEAARVFVRRFPSLKGQDVLEIGCGYGSMLVALQEAGASAVGVDVDAWRVEYARGKGLAANVASVEQLPFDEASFDVVVSDSTIEHIPDIQRALTESHRVLRPGGLFYGLWACSWLNYNGPHLIKCLSIPWIHLVFSDKTIVKALATQKAAGRWPSSYLDYKINDFSAMGRTTRRKLRKAARVAGFEIEEESSWSPRPLKNLVTRVPPFDELLSGDLTVALRKPGGRPHARRFADGQPAAVRRGVEANASAAAPQAVVAKSESAQSRRAASYKGWWQGRQRLGAEGAF